MSLGPCPDLRISPMRPRAAGQVSSIQSFIQVQLVQHHCHLDCALCITARGVNTRMVLGHS